MCLKADCRNWRIAILLVRSGYSSRLMIVTTVSLFQQQLRWLAAAIPIVVFAETSWILICEYLCNDRMDWIHALRRSFVASDDLTVLTNNRNYVWEKNADRNTHTHTHTQSYTSMQIVCREAAAVGERMYWSASSCASAVLIDWSINASNMHDLDCACSGTDRSQQTSWSTDSWRTVCTDITVSYQKSSWTPLIRLRHGYTELFLLCPDLHRERRYHENDGWYLSVCLVPRTNSRTERPRKPKIGAMEAHHTSNPWTYLEVKDQGHHAD